MVAARLGGARDRDDGRALGVGVRRHPLCVAVALAGCARVRATLGRHRRARGRHGAASRAPPLDEGAPWDRRLRGALVRDVQRRAQRGGTPGGRRDRLDARERRPAHDRRARGGVPPRGLPATPRHRVPRGVRGCGRHRGGDLEARPRAELGGGAVRARRPRLRRRRRHPKAAPAARVSPPDHVRGVRGGRARVHTVRAVARTRAAPGAGRGDGMDGVPRGRAAGGRVPHLGVCPRTHDGREDGLVHLPRPPDRDPPRVGPARPDAPWPRLRGRGALPRGRLGLEAPRASRAPVAPAPPAASLAD